MEMTERLEKIRKLLVKEEIISLIARRILVSDDTYGFVLHISIDEKNVISLEIDTNLNKKQATVNSQNFSMDIPCISVYDYLNDYGEVNLDNSAEEIKFWDWVENSEELKRDIANTINDNIEFILN